MSLSTQLRLLLWKNFTLRRRQKVRLLVELLWPLFLFFILVGVRATNHPVYKTQCHYPNKPLPSAGVLPWMQGMLCNMQNPCVNHPTPGEAPGQVNNFNGSIVSQVLLALQELLTDSALFSNAKLLSDDISQWAELLQEDNATTGQSSSLVSFLRSEQSSPDSVMKSVGVVSTSSAGVSLMRAGVRLEQQLDLKRLIGRTGRHVTPLMKAVSGVNLSALVRVMESVDFRSDPLGSFSQLMCGSDLKATPTNTSRAAFRTDSAYTAPEDTPSRNTSEFCRNFTDTLANSSSTRLIWRTFRPFLQGKILFAPDNNVTRSIVAEANRTFDALARLSELAKTWLAKEKPVWEYFSGGEQIDTLRLLLKSPVFSAALDQILAESHLSTALIANLLFSGAESERPAGMPSFDWRDVFSSASQTAKTLAQILSCFDLDKFEGVASEAVLLERSIKLLTQERFWAGVVFLDLTDPRPSPHIRYKIRMDVEDTERTDKVKERSWYPTARDNAFSELRYVRGGFAYLQDMLDRGIIRLQTGISRPLGVYAQQIPYPCYMDDVMARSCATVTPR